MERTGTGSSISVRELATAVGVSHGGINDLLQGHTKTTRHDTAHGICRTLGVDLLVLWAPTGRSVQDPDEPEADSTPAVSVAAKAGAA
jgi:transcriptional regulator with XRE-family HTH domain